MQEAGDLAPLFVPTGAYSQALTVLGLHGFVVLTGPPEMGKTSIALMIGLARLGDGWQVFDCTGPDDLFRVHDQNVAQVFLADDAFGSTEYTPHRAAAWAEQLHKVLRLVDSRHWLVWTSRPAPLKLGLRQLQLQGGAEQFPNPGEVEVDASRLSGRDKALILYKHCKHAALSDDVKEIVRSQATFIVHQRTFTPERIRRLVQYRLPSIAEAELDEDALQKALRAELEQSTDRMSKSFEQLDPEHKRLLVSMLDADTGFVRADDLRAAYERHRPATGETAVDDLIDDLANHFLRPSQ
jgi:hypothetical protein